VSCLPGSGTFYAFADVSRAISALGCRDDAEFAELLLNDAGVAVVPGSGFGAPATCACPLPAACRRWSRRWTASGASHCARRRGLMQAHSAANDLVAARRCCRHRPLHVHHLHHFRRISHLALALDGAAAPARARVGVLGGALERDLSLTPLENHLRSLGGEAGYQGGFLAHYLVALLYPAALTWRIQWFLAGLLSRSTPSPTAGCSRAADRAESGFLDSADTVAGEFAPFASPAVPR